MPLTLAKGGYIEGIDCSSLGVKDYTGVCPTVENINPSVKMEILLSSLDIFLTLISESLTLIYNFFEALKMVL